MNSFFFYSLEIFAYLYENFLRIDSKSGCDELKTKLYTAKFPFKKAKVCESVHFPYTQQHCTSSNILNLVDKNILLLCCCSFCFFSLTFYYEFAWLPHICWTFFIWLLPFKISFVKYLCHCLIFLINYLPFPHAFVGILLYSRHYSFVYVVGIFSQPIIGCCQICQSFLSWSLGFVFCLRIFYHPHIFRISILFFYYFQYVLKPWL